MALVDEIAREFGVSPATVRNVLSGRNKEVWPSAKARADQIREAAARKRYRVNAAARATASGRFDSIALVLSHDDSRVHIFPETLVSVRTAARAGRVNVVLGDLPNESADADRLPDTLRDLSVDGMLLSCLDSLVETVFTWVSHYRVPAIWMNMKLPLDCIYPDDFSGGREAARRLIDLGHKRILYIDDAINQHYSRLDRMAGYEAAMVMAGLSARAIDIHTTPHGEIADMLRANDRPTAAVAYGWEYAVKVYCIALAAGLSVPRDLSLVTFHSSGVVVPDKPIDTMVIPAIEMGRRGFEELRKKIENTDTIVEPIALPFEYFEGATVAPPG